MSDKKGSGSYSPGNPYAVGFDQGGGGSGCHFDSNPNAIDQPDADGSMAIWLEMQIASAITRIRATGETGLQLGLTTVSKNGNLKIGIGWMVVVILHLLGVQTQQLVG